MAECPTRSWSHACRCRRTPEDDAHPIAREGDTGYWEQGTDRNDDEGEKVLVVPLPR